MVSLSALVTAAAAASGHVVQYLPHISKTAAHIATASRIVSVAAGASGVAAKVAPIVAKASATIPITLGAAAAASAVVPAAIGGVLHASAAVPVALGTAAHAAVGGLLSASSAVPVALGTAAHAAVGGLLSASSAVPVALGTAAHAAVGGAVSAAVGSVAHAVPFVGGAVATAAVGAGALLGPIALAVKAATAVIGVGKLAVLPLLIASLAFYNYDLFDPENRPFNVAQVEREYDFIIVGGGSAGSVLANRLSEVGDWRVLLLEAGGHETEISDVPILSLYLHKSKLDWKYRTQPQATACQAMRDKRCCWTRGKVLGGSSVLNTMLYVRGNRRDFDHWESLGNLGWGYEKVLPYFRKSQDQRNPYLARNKRQHGTGGYLTVQDGPYNTPLGVAFVQAGVEMGYDHVDINGEQQTGFAFYQYTMRRGTRCSAAKAFLRPIRLRKNLHVALHSHTTRVLLDKNKRARGVEFWRDGRKHVTFARREVILAAGAIGSPHILLNSGIGPGSDLQAQGVAVRHHLPGVGRNLQDHMAVGGIVWRVDQPVGIITSRLVNLNAAIRYAVAETGPLTNSVGLETVAFVNTKYANASDDWPDMNFLMTSSAWFSDSSVKVAHGLTDKFYDEMYGDLLGKDTFSIVPMMLRPKSRGYLQLNSTDPLAYPLIYHNYFTHPDDVAVMREGVKLAVATGETQALKRFGARLHDRKLPNCRHLPAYTDEYWECAIKQYTMSIYHYSGTSKMGPASDATAVVDSQLRVHGLKGLRVIDASIMPTITNGNINAPTIMIAEKGADMLKEYWLRDKWAKWSRQTEVERATKTNNVY